MTNGPVDCSDVHPNVALIQKLDRRNLAASGDAFAEDFVWHYINPLLPDIEGDYVGVAGLQDFFARMVALTDGTFEVNPVSLTPVGDELLVMQTRNTMTLDGQEIHTDVVLVWRIVSGRITEVWDIPSVHSLAADS